jgi:hypothetical protein
VSLAGFKPFSSGSVCGATIGPRPPDLGYQLTTPNTTVHATSGLAEWSVTLPVRLHNDTSQELVGQTYRTPWTAVTSSDGVIVAATAGMRLSARRVSIPPGGVLDAEAIVPLRLCRERPLNAPREFLTAGIYQIWVDIDIRLNRATEIDDGKVTVRGGAFALVVDAPVPQKRS